MKKKFENMERRGLPGGPNEMFSYVTGVFSTEGYKSDSPDKNNPANLIASGSITMENVEFPVLGMDNLGNSKMMIPGNNYQFPGDMVLEIPMAQKGKSIDDQAQRKYLTDWLKARKATGRFDDQLNEKELNEYIKNIETVQQLTKDEFQTMFPESVSNFDMISSFNSPSGQYIFDTDEIGKDNPKTHHYHAEPSFLTRFTNMFDGLDSVNSTKIHELTHAMTRSKGSGALRKKFPDAGFVDYPIEQAIRNIPIGFGDYYDDPSIFDSYEGDPEEILAQLMQYRYNFNVDPNRVFTKDDIKEVMDNVKKQGDSGIFGLDIFTPENIIRLLNEVAAVDSKDTNTRVAKKGGSVSWQWKGKTYSGTLIPSMEDEKNRYARTKNGKIKTLPKAQEGSENNTLSRRDLIRLIQEQNRLIKEEEERVSNVRANIIPTARRIDEADDPIPFSEFYGVEGASNKEELDAELAKLSPEIRAVLPKNRDGSIYNPAQLTFQEDGSFGVLEADDQLYCTPFGCFAYQEAGATDVPLLAGNYTFVDRAKKGTIPFEKVSSEDAEAGDMAILYADAPRQYRGKGSDETVYRPHHTTILSDKGEDEYGPYMKAYNAIGGNVFNFSESDIDLNEETPEFYRYVGQMPSLKKRQQELIKQFSELPPEVSVLSIEPQSIADLSVPVDNLYVDLPTRVTVPESNQEQKGFFDKLFGKKQLAGEISGDLLLRQVFAESSLDPNAVSPAGARGIAQFMPNTEKELQRLNLVTNEFDPLDPSQARNAQEAYMNYLSERPYLAKGSPEVQLAKVLYAYNRGPNAAKRNLSQLKNSYDIYNSLDWLEGINSESRNYINKILGKDEKFSKEYENILLDSTKSDIVKLYKKFGGDVDLKRIYKNFLDGIYDGTGNEKRAKDIYDKLNRMYYREAKSAGMSMPNYVMTYIIGNS